MMRQHLNKHFSFTALLLVLALAFGTKSQAQQDAQFSQYMFHGLYINPAYAGYRGVWNLNSSYRNQWSGFPGSPKTISAAVDGASHNNRVGMGLNIINDRIGAQNNTAVYGTYAYRFPLDNSQANRQLSLGLSIGAVQNRFDKGKLSYEDVANDPVVKGAKSSIILPDARFGIYYNTDKFYAGISADNLLTHTFLEKKDPNNYFLDRRMHFYATAGGLVTLSDALSLKPSFMLKDDKAGPTSLDINSLLLINNKIWVGGSYRTSVPLYEKPYLSRDLKRGSSVVGIAEVFVGDGLRLGYSYDYAINSSVLQRYGSHEISLGINFTSGPKTKMLSPRRF